MTTVIQISRRTIDLSSDKLIVTPRAALTISWLRDRIVSEVFTDFANVEAIKVFTDLDSPLVEFESHTGYGEVYLSKETREGFLVLVDVVTHGDRHVFYETWGLTEDHVWEEFPEWTSSSVLR